MPPLQKQGVLMINFEKLESLVKIKLTDAERDDAIKYFDGRIRKFDKLADIDTENVEPLISVANLENIMREDVACKIFDRKILLENAHEQHDGYVVVPRILE